MHYIQLTSPLPSQTTGQIQAKHFELFNNMSKIVLLKFTSKWFKLWKSRLWRLPQVSCNCKAFSEKELIHVANPMFLAPMQPKILTSKISHFVPLCTNEYAWEKEEKENNKTIFTKWHEELPMTMSDYLPNNALVHEVTKGWFLASGDF